MRAGDLLVVTRGQLDALCGKLATLRERMALAAHLTRGKDRPCGRLGADSVAREEWLAVSAWEPMLQPAFLAMYLDMATEIVEQEPHLRRLRNAKGKAEEALHGYWNLVHAAGHLLLLATMSGDREHFQTITEGIPRSRSTLSFAMTGMVSFITRGAWAVGRMGKQLLPAYKEALLCDVALFDFLDTVFSLAAIGRRTTGLRAEIAKALLAAPQGSKSDAAARLRQQMPNEISIVCELAAGLLSIEETRGRRGS